MHIRSALGRFSLSAAIVLSAPQRASAQPAARVDAPLQSEIAKLLDALPAQTALYAEHVPTGRVVAVRADQPMSTMSVIKIPIMIQAYRDVEAGRLSLDERVSIREEDLRAQR